MSKLPSFEYQKDLYYKTEFNNELLRGINQGLSLYSPEIDTQLYRPPDVKQIDPDKINFDKLNTEIQGYRDNQNDIYNNVKGAIEGSLDGIVSGTNNLSNKINNGFSNAFDSIKNTLNVDWYKYLGLFILFLIVYKKI